MANKSPLALRVFQAVIWLLLLAVFAYGFLPGILSRLMPAPEAQPASVSSPQP